MVNWNRKKLGDKEYFEILRSGIEKFEGEKEYLSTSSIEGNKIIAPEGKITYLKRPSRANMQPRLNSVWFAKMINTVKVYSFTKNNEHEINKYILSTGFCGILCNVQKVEPKYLEKIFLSEWFNNLKDSLASDKAIQKSLNNKDLENLEIPLPPLPVQQKIVKILDTIQSAVEVQEKIIEKTKELKKALMNLLFHYGLSGLRIKEFAGLRVDELTSSEIKKLGLKLKKTEIGEIPEYWEVVRLGEVCELRKEQVIPNPKEKYVGLEHLDTGESRIRRYGLGSEVKSLKSKFYPKDILYGKLRPYLDKVAVAEFEGLCSTDLLVVAADEDRVLPNYLVELMHTSGFLSFAIGTMSGTNHPRTSWDSLRIFKLPLPPLSEQQEIAEILQTIDQKIEIEKKKKELYYELFKTLLNKIMNQEIEVERIEI